jgi:hypothetical protein
LQLIQGTPNTQDLDVSKEMIAFTNIKMMKC